MADVIFEAPVQILSKGSNLMFIDSDGVTTRIPNRTARLEDYGNLIRITDFETKKTYELDYSLARDENGDPFSDVEAAVDYLDTFVGTGSLNMEEGVSVKTSELFSGFTQVLNDGEEIDSGFLDFRGFSNYDLSFKSDSMGLVLQQESRDDENQELLINDIVFQSSNLFIASFPSRQRFIRFRLKNNTGGPVNSVSLSISGKTTGDGISVFPVEIPPREFSSAALVQSVLIGKDPAGEFKNTGVNQAGAVLTSDFGTEVARGLYEGYNVNAVFGRNADSDIAEGSEDVWNGGGDYTGFNVTSADTLDVVGGLTDMGSLVSSGTATGGSATTLEDSNATFIADGVSVGDIILNDSKDFHGIVTEVTSETILTVNFFKNRDSDKTFAFQASDAYRVASAANSGAAVVKLQGLDENYERIFEYVILNMLTAVTTTKQFLRQSLATVELSGSSGTNEGEITASQTSAPLNITMVMPAESGQTAICCATVPKGKNWVVKHLQAAMVRNNGAAGSAQMKFQTREIGGTWQTKRFKGISNSLAFDERLEGGILIEEKTDVRWRIDSVSDNNTQTTALFEYFEIDKM